MLLELRNLAAGYGNGNVLCGINLTVKSGEIVALIGANGAGKSTLLKTISGLIPLSGGAIKFHGEEIHNLPTPARVRAGIVHVPEGRQIFSGMTVAQNLALGGYARRDGSAPARLSEAIAAFPALSSGMNALAGNLSGGQQQMLAIARGLMAGPRLMLLDEPSLGLSPKLVTEIFELICGLKDRGISILLAEQNARLSLAIASRGYVLENGQITLEGDGSVLANSEEVASKYLGLGTAPKEAANLVVKELAARLRDLSARYGTAG